MQKDRHLIQELKDELDWASGETEYVERQLQEIEEGFMARMSELGEDPSSASHIDLEKLNREKRDKQAAHRLNELYALQHRAARRYALLSRAYEIGATYETAEEIASALSQVLHRSADTEKLDAPLRHSVQDLADALFQYFHRHFDDDAEEKLRKAWLEAEATFKDLGRTV
ncbi:hypothetical protein [Varunaivibrio sulfuroxidans]|uniref:Uncharacterized protein n=1 Tax=Varunaivibrio sulfuroxidans TaxID=1773489 RepID=A0A4V2UPB2_9PROT|nr:hypothetical protein [Varunaivibrio sulfuroxidans]TCS65171.1 hypothetical protein EDD55_101505 [Varunaivibrio sulfuroxidans]WES29547.1 hypothetical protein P3M64_07735 [Varunaivibrio sulfuroxidans]